MSKTVYTVTGMTCGHCAAAVTRALTAVDGVDEVQVNLDSGRVTVHSDAPVPVDLVRAAIVDAGYELAGT